MREMGAVEMPVVQTILPGNVGILWRILKGDLSRGYPCRSGPLLSSSRLTSPGEGLFEVVDKYDKTVNIRILWQDRVSQFYD